MGQAKFIGIDWGSSNLRAWLLDEDGLILVEKSADTRLLKSETGGVAETFKALTHEWLKGYGNLSVLMAGVVGSREGWVEVPYQPCPATATTLAGALFAVPKTSAKAFIVPGLKTRTAADIPDVMRGEETQLVGALALHDIDAGWCCLPGTHSKWTWVENQAIQHWTTHMTGEVFELLVKHSLLGRPMTGQQAHADSFIAGVECAAQGIGLLHDIFSTRSRYLFDELAPEHLHAYLSGLVIGHEVLSMLKANKSLQSVHLIGQPILCKLYATALDYHGVQSSQLDGGLAVRQGLFEIYQNNQ